LQNQRSGKGPAGENIRPDVQALVQGGIGFNFDQGGFDDSARIICAVEDNLDEGAVTGSKLRFFNRSVGAASPRGDFENTQRITAGVFDHEGV